jgi:hypothetical protein
MEYCFNGCGFAKRRPDQAPLFYFCIRDYFSTILPCWSSSKPIAGMIPRQKVIWKSRFFIQA